MLDRSRRLTWAGNDLSDEDSDSGNGVSSSDFACSPSPGSEGRGAVAPGEIIGIETVEPAFFASLRLKMAVPRRALELELLIIYSVSLSLLIPNFLLGLITTHPRLEGDKLLLVDGDCSLDVVDDAAGHDDGPGNLLLGVS